MSDQFQLDSHPATNLSIPPASFDDNFNYFRSWSEDLNKEQTAYDFDSIPFIKPKSTFDFLEYLKDSSSPAIHMRFMKGSHNKTKLKSSLVTMGNLGLLENNLLNADIGKIHAEKLTKRFLRRAKKIDAREAGKKAKQANMKGRHYRRGEKRIVFFSAYQSFKFLTIVHKVVNLCDKEAINEVKRMMQQLNEAFRKVTGISCLGAFEVEVISKRLMRRIRDLTIAGKKDSLGYQDEGISLERMKEIEKIAEEQEFIKLSVCEGLSRDLDESLFGQEDSQLLVHFHGVVCAESEKKFAELRKVLEANPNWKIEPRQIELKCLTKKYGSKVKSVEENLRDIAAYITKGGNDWVGKKPYLRYKLRFSNGTPMSDKEINMINWRSNELIRQDRIDNGGIEDLLSLNVLEINVLAKTIASMQKMDEHGTGYLFTHGRW